jgi:hypothetical protein
VGDAVPGGGLLLRGGRRLRPRRPPRRPLRLRLRRRRRRGRQGGPPPLLRHLMGRRPLGHLHRRHHHVQESAEAPVREPAGEVVPGLLHAHLRLRRRLRRRLRLPPPVEDGVHRRALPARLPPRRPWLRPLQPARVHPHDHRGQLLLNLYKITTSCQFRVGDGKLAIVDDLFFIYIILISINNTSPVMEVC